MENSNNISNSILQTPEPASFVAPSVVSNTGDNSGFFSGLKNISITTWIIIILIFAFLGFNIFVYLAKGTQDITNFFTPLLQKIFGAAATTTGQIANVSAEGAKTVVSGTAGVINSGLSSIQNASGQKMNPQSVQTTMQEPDLLANNTLNKALNTSKMQQQDQDYEANEAHSSVSHSGQSGWCYVGQDQGIRTCAKVSVNDECMSGDIFPSQEICVNPNLRP
jgi:hypothetical protein